MVQRITPLAAFGTLASEYDSVTVDVVSRVIADRCVIREAANIPEIGRDWIGPQGYVDLVSTLRSTFPGFRFETHDIIGGEHALAFKGVLQAQLPAGAFEIPVVEYWMFDAGKAVDILPVWHDVKVVHDLYWASYPERRRQQGAGA